MLISFLYAIQKCIILTAFQYLKGPTRKVEVNFLQEHLVTGQGGMTSNGKEVDLDKVL